MRANTNITRKERSALTLRDFRGADFTSSPLDVASNRAVEIKNLYCDNGQIRKRPGWEQIQKLEGRINGIWEYENEGDKYRIIHAATTITAQNIDDNGNIIRTIVYGTAKDENGKIIEVVENKKSQGFLNNKRLYIIGAGSPICFGQYYNSETKKDEYGFKEAFNNVYVPTTSISINEGSTMSSPNDVRDTLDEVNVLTPWRKNKLLGKDIEGYWYLDGRIDVKTKVTVEISAAEPINDTTHTVSYVAECTFNGVSEELKVIESDDEKPTHSNDSVIGTVSRDWIHFKYGFIPPVEGQDNITVTFSCTTEGHKERITNCTIGTLFGVGGNSDRLFLSGNPDSPNMLYFSKDNDFSYFPDINYIALGSSNAKINGFSRLSDSTLAVLKEPNNTEATMLFVTGSYVTKSLKTGEEYTDEQFSWRIGAIGEGSVSSYACASFAGDNLMLSENGVFGIVLTDNVSTNERYAKERSRLINKRLCAHDLSKATGIVYKNRYYLSVNDEAGSCYVADARYKVSVDDDIDGSFNYEWWYWDNIHARVWAVIDDKLCFGTDDGRICVFDDKFSDRTYSVCDSAADYSVHHVDNKIVFNYNAMPEILESDKVRFLSNIYAVVLENAKLTEDGRIIVPEKDENGDPTGRSILDLHDGMEVYADNVGESGLEIDVKYYVADIDYGSGTFALKAEPNSETAISLSAGGFYLHKNLVNKDLYITDVTYSSDNTENDGFSLKEHPEGSVLDLSRYNSNDSATEYDSLPMYLIQTRPVVAEWCSPPLDFGTAESSKTLLKLTAVAEAVSGGKISFGYETRNVAKEREIKGINKFSLDDLDLGNFTFDTGFANSYSVKVFEKFNFIQFKYVSDNDRDCALNSLTAIYKINKSNIGVK